MTKNYGVFVKINYNLNKEEKSKLKNNKHNYKENKFSKYLLCGGVINKNGGTIIFQANDFYEAEEIIRNNPFVNLESYSFEILSKNSLSLSV